MVLHFVIIEWAHFIFKVDDLRDIKCRVHNISALKYVLGLNTLRQHNSGHNAIVGTSSIIPACCGRAKASPQTNSDVGGQRHSLKSDKAVESTWSKIWAPSWHSFVEWIVCEQMAEQKLWVSRPVIVSHVNFMWIRFCEAHVGFGYSVYLHKRMQFTV